MKDGNLTISEHRLSNRRTKSISEYARKPRKSPKRCLNSVLDSISEDVTIQMPNSSGELSAISELFEENPVYDTAEPINCMYSALNSISEDSKIQTPNSSGELSSISELTKENPVYDTSESSILTMDPVLSPTSETASNDLTILSPNTTMDNEGYITANFDVSAGSAGAEIVVEHLRRTLTQIVSSSNGDPRLINLLDSLITVVIQEFYGSPEEKDLLRKLVSWRNRIMFVSFVLWILALAAILVSNSSSQSSLYAPPPT